MLLSTPPPGRSVRAVCARCARLVHAVWTRCARVVHPVCTHGSPRALAARPQAGRGVAPGAEGTPASPSVTAAPRLSPFALPRRPTQRKILNLNGQQGCDGFHCATPVSRANKYQGADRAGPNRQTAPLAFRGRRRACVASSSSPGPQGAAPARAGASHGTAGLANVPPTPRRLAGPSGAAGRRGDARVAPASCSAPPPVGLHSPNTGDRRARIPRPPRSEPRVAPRPRGPSRSAGPGLGGRCPAVPECVNERVGTIQSQGPELFPTN